MIYYFADNDLGIASAVLRVRGPDANTYLQGQFTQELRVPDGAVAYGLWLDQKGKVLADSHVQKLSKNDFRVVSFSVPASQLVERLQSYLIADEVELLDESEQWTGVLLWGETMGQLDPPAGVQSLPSRRAGLFSVQWLVPMTASEAAAESLKTIAATPVAWPAVELARLRAGVPAVPRDIGPRDLPNEGGLEDVAISYTKGCYLGQEVMARLKNLGQVRRRLHLVQGDGEPPVPGTAVNQDGRRAGEIRSSVVDGKMYLALAMLSLVTLDETAGLTLAAGGHAKILRRV